MGGGGTSPCQCNNGTCNSSCSNSGSTCTQNSQCRSTVSFTIENFQKISGYKKKDYAQFISNEINNDELSNWINSDAKKSFSDIKKIYGDPDILVNKKKGLCIWYINKSDDMHSKIELKDESIEHCVPAPHRDYLYSYFKMYIPKEKFTKILAEISGSIGYDPLKKEIYARCATLEANYATMKTVIDVYLNKKTKYSNNIKSRNNSFENNKTYVNNFLKNHQKKYKNKFLDPYYDGAFPYGCPNLI